MSRALWPMRFPVKVRCGRCGELIEVDDAIADVNESDVLVGWHHANDTECAGES